LAARQYASMSALSDFDSVLPVFEAVPVLDRVVVVAIVSSSPFRCRPVQRPNEARYQLRDDRLNAIVGRKIRKKAYAR
jgi:hypothetical protein